MIVGIYPDRDQRVLVFLSGYFFRPEETEQDRQEVLDEIMH